MQGTLALWYDSSQREPPVGSPQDDVVSEPVPRPAVTLHVNLWRDLDRSVNFLDVGFQIEEIGDLGRLYLYLPAPIARECVADLSGALKDSDTLNAIFNEVTDIEREEDNYFVTKTGDDRRRAIHHLNTAADLTVGYVNVPGGARGTVIALTSRLCRRIASAPGELQYVRLRVSLRDRAKNLFSVTDIASPIGFALNEDILETTEFRLNERRSYPPSILSRATGHEVTLNGVYYFLIRSKGHQLASQHQTFRKARNLEKDIWEGYISFPDGENRAAERAARNSAGMIIYQWRELANEKKNAKLDDFLAYATFRSSKPRIGAYVVAALAIGGVGGAMLNIALSVVRVGFDWMEWARPAAWAANASGALLLIFVAAVSLAVRRLWNLIRKALAKSP